MTGLVEGGARGKLYRDREEVTRYEMRAWWAPLLLLILLIGAA